MITISTACGKSVIVDGDRSDLAALKWHACPSGGTHYAKHAFKQKDGSWKKSAIHHLIIGYPAPGLMVDHINGDGLDNRRVNLRFVTARENQQNQRLSTYKRHSKLPGATLTSILGWVRWAATCKVDGKTKRIGYFHTEEAAHSAYLEYVTPAEFYQNMEAA